jgi:hypothetical protein
MPAVASRHNPFEFGGELKASALIDREQELDLVLLHRQCIRCSRSWTLEDWSERKRLSARSATA